MSSEIHKRINVTFPISLLDDLRRIVPRRERNRFIVEATERELAKLRLMEALEESVGTWSGDDYPDLASSEDVDRFVRRVRESALPRSWDEIAEDKRKND